MTRSRWVTIEDFGSTRNHFRIRAISGSPCCCFQAGVGIRSARRWRDGGEPASRYVHYSGRSRSALALVDEDRVATIHLSDEGTRLDVAALLGSLDPVATIYAAGPRHIRAVRAAAGGHPLHVERFEGPNPSRGSGARGGGTSRSGSHWWRDPPRFPTGSPSIPGWWRGRGVRALQLPGRGTCGTCRDAGSRGFGVDHRGSILTPLEN
jgi:hypothetical protein